MEWYTTPDGHQRIWYDPDEIEGIMAEQLRLAKFRPSTVAPAPDLEAFIEGHLKVDLDQYATLPEDVLGLTEFDGKKQPKMRINADVTNAADEIPARPGARGRWRATLAHEAAHVILHRYLFDPEMVPIRRGDYRDPEVRAEAQDGGGTLNRVQCLHRDVSAEDSVVRKTTQNWREVQANKGMAALLMPETLFIRVAALCGGVKGRAVSGESVEGVALVSSIAEAFEVSRQAASLRLRAYEMLA